MQNFITAAQTAAKDIQYKYKEFWTNPAEKVGMALAKKAKDAADQEAKDEWTIRNFDI